MENKTPYEENNSYYILGLVNTIGYIIECSAYVKAVIHSKNHDWMGKVGKVMGVKSTRYGEDNKKSNIETRSYKFCKWAADHGTQPRKIKNYTFPIVNEKYKIPLFIGVFDGVGKIRLTKGNLLLVYFNSPSKNFLLGLEKLANDLGLRCNLISTAVKKKEGGFPGLKHDKTVYRLSFLSGKGKQVLDFLLENYHRVKNVNNEEKAQKVKDTLDKYESIKEFNRIKRNMTGKVFSVKPEKRPLFINFDEKEMVKVPYKLVDQTEI
jgi:hypothetical protein